MWSWIKKWVKRAAIALVALLTTWCITGLAMAAGRWDNPPRGTLIDVDGRKQRIVCEGVAVAGVPTIIFESGIYSGAADWGYIQPQIAKGGRTCSYDRAGIGW
jgi:hypothetical protein